MSLSLGTFIGTLKELLVELKNLVTELNSLVSSYGSVVILKQQEISLDVHESKFTDKIDISKYKLKTISMTADHDILYWVFVSDTGGFTDYPYYYHGTIVANTIENVSFEEDFMYLKVKFYNPDTNPHTVRVVVKGRRL